MKILKFDSGARFDDPNNRWGSPSYQLEPGDPGYVSPLPQMQAFDKPRKHTTMNRADYVKTGSEGFSLQLNEFYGALTPLAARYGVKPEALAAALADADAVKEALANHHALQKAAQAHAEYLDILINGGTLPTDEKAPKPPPLSYDKQVVPAGAKPRFRASAQLLKKNPQYNTPDGESLGIEGPVAQGVQAAEVQPVFTVKKDGNRIFIDWGWGNARGKADSIIIWVTRGKTKVMLTIDTTVGYWDTEPWPTDGPVRWVYEAQFRKGDDLIGLMSAPVSIVVG